MILLMKMGMSSIFLYYIAGVLAPSAWVFHRYGFTKMIGTFTITSAVTSYAILVCVNPHVEELLTGRKATSSAKRTSDASKKKRRSAERNDDSPVSASKFYAEYHGHKTQHLKKVHDRLRTSCDRMIFLCGDSSLDNKHWLFPVDPLSTKRQLFSNEVRRRSKRFLADAINGYEDVLSPPFMMKDVCYHLNNAAHERRLNGATALRTCTIMTSVEESTLEDRDDDILAQDIFIRDHITSRDDLVVSVGGNDIALRPTLRTAFNMLLLTKSPDALIQRGLAPGLGYFVDFFHSNIQRLLDRVTRKQKPRRIVVCMIYFPDETPGGWADVTLKKLGYDETPEKLQLCIRKIFDGIKRRGFFVAGSKVDVFPLFRVLDGKNHGDYYHRVEPSDAGGKKMANALLDFLG